MCKELFIKCTGVLNQPAQLPLRGSREEKVPNLLFKNVNIFLWMKNGTCGPQNNIFELIFEHCHPEGPHYMTEQKEGELEILPQEMVV